MAVSVDGSIAPHDELATFLAGRVLVARAVVSAGISACLEHEGLVWADLQREAPNFGGLVSHGAARRLHQASVGIDNAAGRTVAAQPLARVSTADDILEATALAVVADGPSVGVDGAGRCVLVCVLEFLLGIARRDAAQQKHR